MKIKKKIVIPVVAAAIVGIAVLAVPRIVSGAGSKAAQVSAAPITKMNLENVVSVTGTVKSQDATNVYSTLQYQVKSVNVEVGDKVNTGDVLCVLDTESLSANINQQMASLSKNQASAQHSLAVAQNNLETEKYNQENHYDTALLNAEKAVEQANQALEKQKSALESAKISLTSAEQSQKSNTKALREWKDDNGGAPKYNEYDATYEQLYQAVVQGELKIVQAENAVVDAERAVEDAKQGVKDAETSLIAVKAQKEQALTAGQQQVRSAQIGADFSANIIQIEEMEKDLDDAIIKAPVSGTVTAVLATEGGNGQGLLFVIENTDSLKVTTKIKEYDIAAVRVGQHAKVKSDGTGDDEYEGKVSKIAPTAVKSANGDTIETTDVQFATEVGILKAGGLKIGMNARIDIVTEEKSDVFAVSYESVVENENGESMVFVARPKPAGAQQRTEDTAAAESGAKGSDVTKMIAVAIPVKTGMETDFYIEIISDELEEGDLIISNPPGLTDGQEIALIGGMIGDNGSGGRRGGRAGMAVRMG